MPKNTCLTNQEIERIKQLYASGKRVAEIIPLVNRSKSAIYKALNQSNINNKMLKKKRGPKGIISKRGTREMERSIRKNPFQSVRSLTNKLDIRAGETTVRRTLHQLKYKSRRARVAPPLRQSHKKDRIEFALKHLSERMDWRTVFFSDEKKFNFDGPDGNRKVWVKEGESKENFILYRRQQGGGSVMCWVGFCYTFKGPLFFFNGTVNADSYVKHLKNNFLPWYIEQNFKPVYFQHDNAPPHVSQVTKKSLVEWGLDVLKWPANSPDLNPVENLWKLLSDAVYANGKQYTSRKELEKAIKEAYEKIDPDQLENLVKSMEKRLALVLLKQGEKIKY